MNIHLFDQDLDNFPALLLYKIKVLEFFDIGDLLRIFISRNTEIWNKTISWECTGISWESWNLLAIHPSTHQTGRKSKKCNKKTK